MQAVLCHAREPGTCQAWGISTMVLARTRKTHIRSLTKPTSLLLKKFLSKPEPQLELFFLKNFRFTNFFFSSHFWPSQSCEFPHLARRLLKNVLSPWSTGAPRGHSASARSSPRPDRDPLRCKNNYRGTPGGQSNGQMCPLRPFFSFFCLVESLVCPTFPPTWSLITADRIMRHCCSESVKIA